MRRWKTLSGDKISDLSGWVRRASALGQEVHIGTDSLQTDGMTQFVTVVVIHTPGKGGRVAYTRSVVPKIGSLRARLLREVWESVDLGLVLSEAILGPLTVHIDANPEVQFKSSRYIQELVGMVMGQGFRSRVKPEAWAGSHVADHIVRHHGRIPA